jgi:hypothetical protein
MLWGWFRSGHWVARLLERSPWVCVNGVDEWRCGDRG